MGYHLIPFCPTQEAICEFLEQGLVQRETSQGPPSICLYSLVQGNKISNSTTFILAINYQTDAVHKTEINTA